MSGYVKAGVILHECTLNPNTLGAKFSRFVVILFKIHGMKNIIYDYEISRINLVVLLKWQGKV